MRMIVAKRRNVIRKFTEIAWKNLGANKSGWVEIQDQQVSNSIQKPEMKTGKPVEVPVVKNAQKQEEVEVHDSTPESKQEPKKLTVEDKKAFVEKHLAQFEPTSIKDFLDSVNVKYGKKDSEDTLRVKLAEFLEYSEEKLNQHLG